MRQAGAVTRAAQPFPVKTSELAGTVVIVDSIQTGKAAPGFLHELDATTLNQLTGHTPHFVGVSETLALGKC